MTPTPKEGPPTLSILKPLLDHYLEDQFSSPFHDLVCLLCDGVEPDHEDGCVFGELEKFRDRLTDEALERDEKRRAALEEENKKLREWLGEFLPRGYSHGKIKDHAQRCHIGSITDPWCSCGTNEAREFLALTPAPEEKEKA